MAITSNIWYFSNVVKHVSTCEEKDKDQANGSPDVAVLNQRCHVWPSNTDETNDTEECSGHGNIEHIVHRSVDFGVWAIGEMASDPRAYLFSRLSSNERELVKTHSYDRVSGWKHTHW